MDARISTSLPAHHKTKKLARRLGPAGPLACIYLFLWAAANRTDGDLSGMSDEDIELAVDWAGDPSEFVSAMVEVRFLDGDEGTRRIHDWAEHNPWAAGAEDRSEAGKWGALCKRYGRAGAAERMPEYANRMRTAHEPQAQRTGPHCESDAPSPSPSPSPKKKEAAVAALPPTPEWIEQTAWDGFVAMRRRERHPLTERAAKLVIAELGRLRAAGHDPNACLDNSTRNGWRDVFAPREPNVPRGTAAPQSGGLARQAKERALAPAESRLQAQLRWLGDELRAGRMTQEKHAEQVAIARQKLSEAA